MQQLSNHHHRKRTRLDYFAQRVVVFFGWAVLATLGILIWHLVSQSLPILKSPSIEYLSATAMPEGEDLLYIGDIERGGFVISRAENCALHLYVLSMNRKLQRTKSFPHACSTDIYVQGHTDEIFIAERSNHNILRIQKVISAGGQVSLQPVVSQSLASDETPVSMRSVSVDKQWVTAHFDNAEQQSVLWINRQDPSRAIRQSFAHEEWVVPMPSSLGTVLATQERLVLWSIFTDRPNVEVMQQRDDRFLSATEDPRSIYSSVVDGQLGKWSLRNIEGQWQLVPMYNLALDADESPVSVHIDASVNLGLILTSKARVLLFNRVTGERLYQYALASSPQSASWYGDNLYISQSSKIDLWYVADRASTTTLAALFQPQQYPGYSEADYIWQTTNATDYQLAKYSLVPLFIGSLKAALLALVVAIPLSIGSAIYIAYFAHPKVRNKVKPTIEMLEAVPSVVIGFIAAIWLAPLAEQFLIALAIFILFSPIALSILALGHHHIVNILPERGRKLWELPAISSLMLLIGMGAMAWGIDSVLTFSYLFNLEVDQWLTQTQLSKTTLVVALALGVAISPTIFSLAEDAIEGVPNSLKQASFALGATQLQTLRNVVLKVALPGIIAALMLGFGRAFGETMIVLMVTGNTPIADWDLFEGLRALTANLAIELPEVEVGSAHYRVLFVTATGLFVFTFIINTIAEMLRMRARRLSVI
ncbi:ABC transporter permease subunit [Alteromonas sp. ASW11-36]|uniref:ABC transporter permease subunit n=1 Tax=Alteromonas arenosi TaxID=3055817 RepID=A0ABT7T099_9ALTE|nr:ABC transporter permease subunit [Alteromonas sp. ASW11-36]MDM7861865.1 ABC transporter permease subunit [Alteromonas sp. ASW11-36]